MARSLPNELSLPPQRLIAIADSLPFLVAYIDRSQKYIFNNQAFSDWFGKSIQGINGSHIAVVIGEKSFTQCRMDMERCMAGEHVQAEIRLVRPSGQLRHVSHTMIPDFDAAHQVQGILTIMQDITKTKRAEFILRSRDHLLSHLARGADLKEIFALLVHYIEAENPDIKGSILILDTGKNHLLLGAAPSLPDFYNNAVNGLKIGPNTGSCGTAAWLGERVIVPDIAEHPYWEDYREVADKAGLRACWSEPIWSSHHEVLGTLALYYEEPREPSNDDIEFIETTAKIASLTIERHQTMQALQQAQKMESLGLLAGGVAHDLNSLLDGVFNNAKNLAQSLPEEAPEQKPLRSIVQAAESMADLNEQMMAYSGQSRIKKTSTDLNFTLNNLVKILHGSIPQGIELRLMLTDKLPQIHADPTQIQQIALNLVRNAWEATENHRGRVIVLTQAVRFKSHLDVDSPANEQLQPGTYVCLEVTDNGSGMENEILHKVFDPFFTTKFLGRGMGLPAVQGIVKNHNGGIRVRSEAGQGTTVKVFFPVATEELPSADQVHASSQIDVQEHGVALVVDSEIAVCKILKEFLEYTGLRVHCATNDEECLHIYSRLRKHVDLCFMDLSMPGQGGMNIPQKILTQNPEAKIILMSNYEKNEAQRRYGSDWMHDYLQKPFRLDEVMALTIRALPQTR